MMKQKIKFPKKELRELKLENQILMKNWQKEKESNKILQLNVKSLFEEKKELYKSYVTLQRELEDLKYNQPFKIITPQSVVMVKEVRSQRRFSVDELMLGEDLCKTITAKDLAAEIKPYIHYFIENDQMHNCMLVKAKLFIGVKKDENT